MWDRARDEIAWGAWVTHPSPHTAEIFARSGVDYVCIDCQHGLMDIDAAVPLIMAASLGQATVLVRSPGDDPHWIGKALDLGVDGVIVPMVESAAQTEAVVRACRYPPQGDRSFGPIRAGLVHGPDPAEANDRVKCVPMIETAKAVTNVAEIVAIEGVDAIYLGPNDLAYSMGLAPSESHESPEFLDSLHVVATECGRAGVLPGISGSRAAARELYQSLGYRWMTIATDAPLLQSGIQMALDAARSKRAE